MGIFCLPFQWVSAVYLYGFGTTIYRQFIGIPMGANCTPLVAALFVLLSKRSSLLLFLMINKSKSLQHFTQHIDIRTKNLL